MKIPEYFTINTQRVSVVLKDEPSSQRRFGEFNSLTSTITIYTVVRGEDGNITNLSNEQILNTFFHEVFHAWQWYSGHDDSEVEASTYAGYMIEFLRSTSIDRIDNLSSKVK